MGWGVEGGRIQRERLGGVGCLVGTFEGLVGGFGGPIGCSIWDLGLSEGFQGEQAS